MMSFKGRKYESSEEMPEIMNKCFQTAFMRESDFVQLDRKPRMAKIENVVENVRKITGDLDVRKAPDGVSNWVLRKCKEDLAGTVTCMTE